MSQIVKETQAGRAALRPLKQPLYDTGHLPSGVAVNRLAFFQAAIGSPIVAAGALKTEADTNLQQSGQIGRPLEFRLFAFRLEIQSDAADLQNNAANFHAIYDEGAFQFLFAQQKPWYEGPVTDIPNGAGLEGLLVTADDGTPTEYGALKNGIGSCKQLYDFTVGKKSVPIGSSENFSAVLSFPQGAVTITTTGAVPYRVRCYLVGILFTSL